MKSSVSPSRAQAAPSGTQRRRFCRRAGSAVRRWIVCSAPPWLHSRATASPGSSARASRTKPGKSTPTGQISRQAPQVRQSQRADCSAGAGILERRLPEPPGRVERAAEVHRADRRALAAVVAAAQRARARQLGEVAAQRRRGGRPGGRPGPVRGSSRDSRAVPMPATNCSRHSASCSPSWGWNAPTSRRCAGMPSVSRMARSVATRAWNRSWSRPWRQSSGRAAEHRDAVGALAEGLEHEVLADAPDAGGQHAHPVALAAPAAPVEALQGVVRRPLAREDHDPRGRSRALSGEGGGEGFADLAVAGQGGVRRADRADREAAAAERARGRLDPRERDARGARLQRDRLLRAVPDAGPAAAAERGVDVRRGDGASRQRERGRAVVAPRRRAVAGGSRRPAAAGAGPRRRRRRRARGRRRRQATRRASRSAASRSSPRWLSTSSRRLSGLDELERDPLAGEEEALGPRALVRAAAAEDLERAAEAGGEQDAPVLPGDQSRGEGLRRRPAGRRR